MIDERLRQWADDRRHEPQATGSAVAAIAARASERKKTRRVLVAAGAANAAVAIVVALTMVLPGRSPELAVDVLYAEHGRGSAPALVGGAGRVVARVGDDLIGVAKRSVVTVAAANADGTRLVLEAGSMAAKVAPRATTFVVQAGAYEVRVIGTRFAVARIPDGVEVSVEEGVVEVVGSAVHRVEAGQRLTLDAAGARRAPLEGERAKALLTIGAAPAETAAPDAGARAPADLDAAVEAPGTPTRMSPDAGRVVKPRRAGPKTRAAPRRPSPTPPIPTPPLPPRPESRDRPPERAAAPATVDLSALRAQILAGDPSGAKAALEAHLAQRPDDVAALRLLATACTRAKDLDGARRAWRAVAAASTGADRIRARFQVATLHQRAADHEAAVEDLRSLIDEGAGPLEPDARLRLAASLEALGRDSRLEYRAIIERFPGTAAADAAASKLRR